MPQPSVLKVLAKLSQRYPDSPFMALGQTPLWDEPMKASWLRLLNEIQPQARMIAGVHDTDYFAKTTALVPDMEPYLALPHDDARTRGLWSAAGEMSSLFGSEDVPTHGLYERCRIPFASLADAAPEGKANFWSTHTQASGWRGIVHTQAHNLIAHDVPLGEVMPAVVAQIDWAFGLSIASLGEPAKGKAQEFFQSVRAWVTGFDRAGATLSELYRSLLPRLYEALLGQPAQNLEISHSVALFRFNAQTAHLPRFLIIGLFIDPKTRDLASRAYDKAVAGGGMYPLSAFGEAAIPFDLVVPGTGRGTLHVSGKTITMDLGQGPFTITAKQPVNDLVLLASALEERFGPDVAVVGKAVTLIDMLAAEFTPVMHDTASAYTVRTAAMNKSLRESGVNLDLQPIVRLAYPTWDALAGVPASTAFHLPEHLDQAFGAKGAQIGANDFAARWRHVVRDQKAVMASLKTARSPRERLAFLDAHGSQQKCWPCLLEDFEKASTELALRANGSEPLVSAIRAVRDRMQTLTRLRQELEIARGNHFRSTLLLLRQNPSEELEEQEAHRLEIGVEIEACRAEIRQLRSSIRSIRMQLRAYERAPEAAKARQARIALTREAELAEMQVVRTAFLTSEGLTHTNARPTSWWLPLVDPSGAWFARIVEGVEARMEEV